MAELFDKDSDTIGLHLKIIFAEEELVENSTTEFFSVVQKEGKRAVARKIKCYNLDAIIIDSFIIAPKQTFKDATVETGIIIFSNEIPQDNFTVTRWDTLSCVDWVRRRKGL
jgi:hypothetical protein